jgi:hypothetical protein
MNLEYAVCVCNTRCVCVCGKILVLLVVKIQFILVNFLKYRHTGTVAYGSLYIKNERVTTLNGRQDLCVCGSSRTLRMQY